MNFSVEQVRAPEAPAGTDGSLVVLKGADGSSASIWPALGFNCHDWTVPHNGQRLKLLHAEADLFQTGKATRSGNPVLFPFPNRIRAGHFHHAGRSYSLPLTGDNGATSIHGFACRHAWRVISTGTEADHAHVTGEFQAHRDAPETAQQWPADHTIRLTIRLFRKRLRFEAEVHNPDSRTLPFGLGYHPYFATPFSGPKSQQGCRAKVPAREYWELEKCLPTGKRIPVDPSRDLNNWVELEGRQLDDVLTGLPDLQPDADGLVEVGALAGLPGDPGAVLRVRCDKAYRHVVVFTPGNRESFCIEPYTCLTDAANLEHNGVPSGWMELRPGASWTSIMEWTIG
ncbi:MAG: aldose 1-epimerase [Planctomycetes bacterium]|nr:aldose 1-epimerase [Planctomycetota bacterium]